MESATRGGNVSSGLRAKGPRPEDGVPEGSKGPGEHLKFCGLPCGGPLPS
jgi:hypothetical protein